MIKYFDVVNKQDEVVGFATDKECHNNPNLIHRVVHFTLVDGVKEKILITQRSPKIAFDSGRSCFPGEHLLKGDNYHMAISRAIHNELGMDPKASVGWSERNNAFFRYDKQTEFARFFIVQYENQSLQPDQKEIADYAWLSLPELFERKETYSKMTQYWLEHCDWKEIMRFSHTLATDKSPSQIFSD